jgi:hypothetical protein
MKADIGDRDAKPRDEAWIFDSQHIQYPTNYSVTCYGCHIRKPGEDLARARLDPHIRQQAK